MSKLVTIVSRGWFCSIHGGSERFITKIAERLNANGFRVIGITRWIPAFEYPRASHELRIFEDRRPKPFIASLRFSWWAAKVVNQLRPDVAIVNCYWGEASPIFISRDIPVIAVIHDVGLFKSEWAKRHKVKHFLRVQILKRVVSHVDTIVVPSKAVKQDLIMYLKADAEKIRVLGFEGVEGPFRYVHEENEWFDIVQVGRFAPNKGQHILLEAFKRITREIPRARLWLVGGKGVDPEHIEYLNKVLSMAKEINKSLGEERVKVLIDVPNVESYYRIADLCVAPSISEEGFGLTVVECMAFGKPVIASDIFVETGVASNDRAYVIPRGDAEALAKMIIYVYKNYERALEKAKRGLEFAKNCSWDRVARVFIEIIDELLRGRK